MIVFVVGNAVQERNARAVAAHLDDVVHLDLWTLRTSAAPPDSWPGHTPPVSVGAVRAASGLPFTAADVVVLPQDTGVLQRAVAAAARRGRARVVLLPDGVITSARIHSHAGLRRWALDQVDRAGRSCGLVAGLPGAWAGTDPDLALLWGDGWTGWLTGRPERTTVVGCPRMDVLADVAPPPEEPQVLVCSQPLHVAPAWAVADAPRWYACLERLFATPRPGLRLRLHPRELQDEVVPAALKQVTSRRPMTADLAAASVVAAPFSTVLLEAAGCGRGVVSLVADEAFAARTREFAFLSPPWVPTLAWGDVAWERIVACENVAAKLTADYLVGIGAAAEAAAGAIRDL